MDLKSDSENIKHLLNSDAITYIEFSENQIGGDNSYEEDFYKIFNKAQEYSKKFVNSLKNSVETFDNEIHKPYLFDYSSPRSEENIQRSLEKNNLEQTPKSEEKNTEYINKFLNEVKNLKNQSGGEEKKKKKPVNKTLGLMIELTKIMNSSNKHKDIKYKNFMKASKKILDEAKTKAGTTEITDDVIKIAKEIANNPEKFIEEIRKMQNISK